MRIVTTFLSIGAGALFVASLVLAFLGADSVERPATRPLLLASMICLAASIIVFVARLLCAAAQRRHTDA